MSKRSFTNTKRYKLLKVIGENLRIANPANKYISIPDTIMKQGDNFLLTNNIHQYITVYNKKMYVSVYNSLTFFLKDIIVDGQYISSYLNHLPNKITI